MKAIRLFLCAVVLFLAGIAPARAEGIAAIVNEDAITISDINARLKLMIVSSGLPNNNDIRERMKNQVLGMLVDESLQMQESRQLGIEITPEEIDNGFSAVAQQNNMDAEKFKAVLAHDGIQISTLRDQIHAQIAWGKVVQKKLRSQIDVTEGDIDEREQFLKSSLGKTQYRIAEIFLPVDSQQQDAEILTLARRLATEIMQNKAPFPQVAAQFSQGATAARGGDLGWIQEGQLPDPLNTALISLQDGSISPPLRSLTGYHLILLRGKRTVQAENLPTRDQIMNQIGTERLDRLQRRYLMDLKSEAFVERRV